MSSINEIKKEIEKTKYLYGLTQNENAKLSYKKKLDDLGKALKEAKYNAKNTVVEKPEKKEEPKDQELKQPEQPPKKEFNNDINRGKVAEPGSNIPDNKHNDDKKEDNKNNHNRK